MSSALAFMKLYRWQRTLAISPKTTFRCEQHVHWREDHVGNLILSGFWVICLGKECIIYLKRDKELEKQRGGWREEAGRGRWCTYIALPPTHHKILLPSVIGWASFEPTGSALILYQKLCPCSKEVGGALWGHSHHCFKPRVRRLANNTASTKKSIWKLPRRAGLVLSGLQ